MSAMMRAVMSLTMRTVMTVVSSSHCHLGLVLASPDTAGNRLLILPYPFTVCRRRSKVIRNNQKVIRNNQNRAP